MKAPPKKGKKKKALEFRMEKIMLQYGKKIHVNLHFLHCIALSLKSIGALL